MKYRNWLQFLDAHQSPSMRREWIEIQSCQAGSRSPPGLPPCGGSGLKCRFTAYNAVVYRLPPCGGSGLKFVGYQSIPRIILSPSMRREWIEIHLLAVLYTSVWSPSMRREWIEICERCQQLSQIRSPSMRREWIEMTRSTLSSHYLWSPSMRREWIEIAQCQGQHTYQHVSLHAEGVD